VCHAVQVRIERAAELFDGAFQHDRGSCHVHFDYLQALFAGKGAHGVDVVRGSAKLGGPLFAGQRCGRWRSGSMRVDKSGQARIELSLVRAAQLHERPDLLCRMRIAEDARVFRNGALAAAQGVPDHGPSPCR
jgi:hypothetical protein